MKSEPKSEFNLRMNRDLKMVMNRFVRLALTCLATLFFFGLNCHSEERLDSADASLEFFEKDVRPILVARCFECHSGEGTPKGGLRLDSRAAILKGGDTGPAVTLENPAASLLVSAINYGDIYQMPPKSKMPAREIEILTKWIETGAAWPQEAPSSKGSVKPFDLATRAAEHWCWQPVKDSSPPDVRHTGWSLSTVDRFIMAKLESRELSPAAPADKRVLLRRVYFDLIGLPPSAEEVEEFVQDPALKAFENVIDRLLESVHFGERWGRHWLDLTRYAETRGHEFEPAIPNAWQYRDYVIRAINSDVPYDRFLAEHIAGDLVEPRWRDARDHSANSALPINESLLGTGFWFLGEEVHSPVDIRKDETDRMDNRLDVMTKTFLGLTVACARCHDHKFDAISQRDYYALAGFAISGSYRQIRVDTFEQHRRIAHQLDELRTTARRETANAILQTTQSVLARLDAYWLTAKRVLEESTPNSEIAATKQSPADSRNSIVDRLAIENKLDATILGRWCDELNLAKDDMQHPLHQLFAIASKSIDRKVVDTSNDSERAVSTNKNEQESDIVVDFSNPDSNCLIQDGVSFGLKPVTQGQLVFEGPPEAAEVRVSTVGGWRRDLFWKNNTFTSGTELDHGPLGTFQEYGRMVRTPEFTLTKRNVWYLVRGSVHAYAAVNSHTVIVGPLHGSLLREFKHSDDQWHWVQHGLDQYQGHRMHVDFSPVENAACTIAMVVQSDKQPTLAKLNWNWLQELASSGQTMNQRVAAYHDAFRDAANSIIDDRSIKQIVASDSLDSQDDLSKSCDNAKRSNHAFLADWFVTHRQLFSIGELRLSNALLRESEAELAKNVQWESTLAPTILNGNGVDEYLLVRGNSNTPKELVPRRFLEAFHGLNRESTNRESTSSEPSTRSVSPPLPRSASVDTGNDDPRISQREDCHGNSRLKLAREMLRSPLASRVAVNRIWHHLFGRGIVPTVDNMGLLGQPPSHPELLDHLATQFVRSGWSTKAMIRSLVLSRTYQMSSHPTDFDSLDPDNELWHRMPIKRLEGEIIRDSMLAVSGRLDRKTYGPSVPIHLTEFMQGRGRPGASGPIDGNGRRSIYISVRRNFLSPMMLAFDTPSPFSTVGRRTVSNVPAQALILMNDPFVIEQAKLWADRILADQSQSTEQRLDRLYLAAFARHATPEETAEALNFLDSQIQSHPENQHAAWGNLCHVMFNVKEFVFID